LSQLVSLAAGRSLAAADERLASPPASIGLLALGLLLLYGAYAAWTGRWRRWAGSVPDINVPLTIFPFLGWLMAGGALFNLLPGIVTALLAAPGVVLMALIPFMLFDFHWFGPGWYRDFKRARAKRERAQRGRQGEARTQRERGSASAAPGVGPDT